MKKLSLFIAALFLIMMLLTGTAFAETTAKTIILTPGKNTVQINGQKVPLATPAKIISDTTYVPLRFITETFGCDLEWDNRTRTATIKIENQEIIITIGKTFALVNDVKTTVMPALLLNGSAYVPLTFMGDNFGVAVVYNPDAKNISMWLNTYKNKNLNFEMVLPWGWDVYAEDNDHIVMEFPSGDAVGISLVSTDGTLRPDNVDLETLLGDYANKEGFDYSINWNMITASFYDDEFLCCATYVFLDNGVYFLYCVTDDEYPEDAKFILSHYDIMCHTIKTLPAKE